MDLRDVDWSNVEELEQLRDEVAGLPDGEWALRREEALPALGEVVDRLRVDS